MATCRAARIAVLLMLLGCAIAKAEIEIVLQNDFIETYKDRATIDVNYIVDKAHAHPNPPAKDGDMHVAGRADEVKLPIVAEIMNAKTATDAVDLVHEVEGTGKETPLSGAWRIWCEHGGNSRQVQGEKLEPFDTTNPPHVFEIHPMTSLNNKSLLFTFHEIDGFETKDAETAFNKYENLHCEITPDHGTTTISTRMAGYNYVEFAAQLAPETKEVEDGRFVFAEIHDLEGELLVRKRRLVFIKDSPPEVKTRGAHEMVHLLGIPRIDLALVSWRTKEASRPGGNQEVLKWGLPYEIIVVGYYGTLDEGEHEHRRVNAAADHQKRRFVPLDVETNAHRNRLFDRTHD
jgi:hypothetical protein